MSKDRPRNRSGKGASGGGFRPPGRGGGPRRGPGRPPGEEAEFAGDPEKPWQQRREPRPASAEPARASRPHGKNPGKPSRPGDFRNKPAQGESRSDRPDKWRGSKGRSGEHANPYRRDRSPDADRTEPETDEILDAEEGDDAAPWTARGRGERRGARPRFERREHAFEAEGGDVWIWGLHAAGAALANPKRRIHEALLTRNAAQRLGLDPEAPPAFVKLLDPREIDDRLPEGAVHQGAGLRAAPLEPLDISDVLTRTDGPLVILDQLTDPQNVGAVFRSAAAFGLGGVVMQTRRAPALGGALAKAAAGGIEATPEIRAVNLARAIDALRDAGWRVVGLDGAATTPIAEAFAGTEPLAIVLGAEGSGLRPAVANACSQLARIPMSGAMESLNVSNAAAIAFYEAGRRG